MERFRRMQIKLDELTQPGWEDTADYCHDREKKYCTSALRAPAVVQPQTDDDAAAPSLTKIGEVMEGVDIDPGISQMALVISRQGGSYFRLGSGTLQSNTSIFGLAPAAKPDLSLMKNVKPVELCKLLLLHIISTAYHHIEIGFRQRHGDGSCVCRGIESHKGIVDVISQWKDVCVPTLLHVSVNLISVTKLWDMMIRLCMCKGQTDHPKVVESKSGCKMANTFDFCLQATVKWESNS